MSTARSAPTNECAGCHADIGNSAAFRFAAEAGGGLRCRRCALLYVPMLRRSGAIALIVGTVLLAINQGDLLLSGTWTAALAWKIPLTYLVPFVVATCGALLTSRVR